MIPKTWSSELSWRQSLARNTWLQSTHGWQFPLLPWASTTSELYLMTNNQPTGTKTASSQSASNISKPERCSNEGVGTTSPPAWRKSRGYQQCILRLYRLDVESRSNTTKFGNPTEFTNDDLEHYTSREECSSRSRRTHHKWRNFQKSISIRRLRRNRGTFTIDCTHLLRDIKYHGLSPNCTQFSVIRTSYLR